MSISVSQIINSVFYNLRTFGTRGMTLPTGSISERPAIPDSYEFRANNEKNCLEYWSPQTQNWEEISIEYSQDADYGLISETTFRSIDYGSAAELNNTPSKDYND